MAATDAVASPAALLVGAVDWSQPALASLRAAAATDEALALALIRHLRARPEQVVGFDAGVVQRVRTAAAAADIRAATARWEAACEQDLYLPYHRNAFAALGVETLVMAATPALCRRAADCVLAERERWPQNPYLFGTTHGIMEAISQFWWLPECDDADLLPWFGWLVQQSAAEWRSLSQWTETLLGSSGHNWYAHALGGFALAGWMLPELRGFGAWRELLPSYVERELRLLFEDDGWSKEGAAGYHAFAAKACWEMAELAERVGRPLSAEARERLDRAFRCHWLPMTPDGALLLFHDEIRLLRDGAAWPQHPCAWRQWAAAFAIPEIKYLAEALGLPRYSPIASGLWMGGHDYAAAYAALPAAPPAALDTVLPRSGLYCMRSGWDHAADYLAVNAGPVGDIVTSHKHMDLFNIELYARGRRLLVDNGYGESAESHADPRVRRWRVGTAAHSTCTVDAQDQAPVESVYRYGRSITPVVDDWRSTPDYAYFSAAHEGYRHLPEPVSCTRRKIFYLRQHYWIVIDRFTPATAAEHDYALHFQVAPAAHLRADGSLVTTGAGPNLLIAPVPGAAGTPSLTPNPYPIAGYENPSQLVYRHRCAGPWLFVTLLLPFTDAAPALQMELLPLETDHGELAPWQATALRLSVGGETHLYVDQHTHWHLPWHCAGVSGEGRLYHGRL